MVIVVKTQIEKMYAHPNTPYNYKISSNISLLFYKCHCLDLRFQTTPFRGWCSRSQILLYLELYNLETLQPKLHYLYSQFLRNMIWMGHQAECESSKSMFPTFDPHQLLARLSILGKQQQCCLPIPQELTFETSTHYQGKVYWRSTRVAQLACKTRFPLKAGVRKQRGSTFPILFKETTS